jgi:large subunit ribosomal protein L4e
MSSATKTFRRWHRHVNKNQRRLAVASALAASAVPALVTSRGHRIDAIPEIPFVVDDAVTTLNKTSGAVAFLKAVGAASDVEKVDASRHVRATRGKWRNRRYVSRKGPLLVLANRAGANAFSNVRGVDVAYVDFLNLLQLAPGGHLGRFVIWTKGAFEKLQSIYGSVTTVSTVKAGFQLPLPIVKNEDITRVINSAEIQKVLRGKKRGFRSPRTNVNPLRNRAALKALSPLAATQFHNRVLADKVREKAAASRRKNRRAEVKARREGFAKAKASNKKTAPKPKKAVPKAAAAKPAAKQASKGGK